MSAVRIYLLDSPKYISGVVLWLCQAHLRQRIKAGWQKTGAKPAPHDLPCDDCVQAGRRAEQEGDAA